MKGGARKGAGRPKGTTRSNTKMVSVRLPIWLADWLKEHGQQAQAIKEALIEYYKLRPPK